MRNQFLWAAALAVAVAATGCSNEEQVVMPKGESNMVGFKPFAPQSLRATNCNEVLEKAGFEVFAFNTTTKVQFMGSSASVGVPFSYTNGAWGYTNASDKTYWGADTYNFYAYSPADNSAVIQDITFGGQALNYIAPATATDQVDVMYASAEGISKDDRDGSGSGVDEGGVPLTFKHALAQVSFLVKSAVDEYDIDIENIELCNVQNAGNFSCNPGIWALTANSPINMDVEQGTEISNIGSTAAAVGSPLYIIPQTFSAWTTTSDNAVKLPSPSDAMQYSYLKISCRIASANDAGSGSLIHGTTSGYENLYIPFGDILEAGNKYTYTLVFGNDGGAGGGAGFDEEGKPILKDILITFIPTVTCWDVDNNTTDVNM